jgi:hypothetical protein
VQRTEKAAATATAAGAGEAAEPARVVVVAVLFIPDVGVVWALNEAVIGVRYPAVKTIHNTATATPRR